MVMTATPKFKKRVIVIRIIIAFGIGICLTILSPCAQVPFSPSTNKKVIAKAQSLKSTIFCLARIEPHGGLLKIGASSYFGASLISELHVQEGDQVHVGQVLAVLDSRDRLQATLHQAESQLKVAQGHFTKIKANVKNEDEAILQRLQDELDHLAEAKVEEALATVERTKIELKSATIFSPIDGQVIKIYTHPGEKVGENGILELGDTAQMDVVAEVYETDVGGVQVGQHATISSDALPIKIHGRVEHVGLKIGKNDVLNTDPVANVDARVVEVKIRLDESHLVMSLIHLQVKVEIYPD